MDSQRIGWATPRWSRRDAVNAAAAPLFALCVMCGSAPLWAAPAATGQTPDTGAAGPTLRLPAATYPEAVRLLRSGQPEAALTRLDTALDGETPEPLDALVLRASALGAAGRGPEAEVAWRQVIDREVWMRTFARRAVVESLAMRGAPALASSPPGGTRPLRPGAAPRPHPDGGDRAS